MLLYANIVFKEKPFKAFQEKLQKMCRDNQLHRNFIKRPLNLNACAQTWSNYKTL